MQTGRALPVGPSTRPGRRTATVPPPVSPVSPVGQLGSAGPVGQGERQLRAAALGLAGLAVAWCCAFIGWQFIGGGDEAQIVLVGDLAPMLPMASAGALALRAARLAPDRRTASAYRLMALAFSAYLGATVLWAWFELVWHIAPWPSLADAGFLAYFPLLLAGLLRLPGPRRPAGERVRLTLDISVVVLASAMAIWYFVVGPTVRAAEQMDLSTVLSLAYPVGDLVLVFGVATLLLRGAASSRGLVLPLLLAGCCAFVIGDIGFAALSLRDAYSSGDWPDAFWMVAWTVTVVGLAAPCRTTRPTTSTTAHRSRGTLPRGPVALHRHRGRPSLSASVAWRTVGAPLDGLLLGAAAITVTVVLRQVTALRDNVRLLTELHELATTDPLTHLANRRHFLEVAASHLHGGGNDGLCLIMADIDHFKSINDHYGHGAGDEALCWLAQRCQAVLPQDAVIGRVGGDEFVALLPGRTLDESTAIAERLVESVAGTLSPVASGPERMSVSLGVASAHGCPDVASLILAADSALYVAKGRGRNRACAHPTLEPTGVTR